MPLRGHAGDVQDIAWAPDSSALMSGSVENICIMWDVEGASRKCRLEDHRNYVQVDRFWSRYVGDELCHDVAVKLHPVFDHFGLLCSLSHHAVSY